MWPSRLAILCIAVLSFPLPGAEEPSSSVIHVVGGEEADGLGYSITGLGDVNGDGVPDFAAGAIQQFFDPEARGYVRLYSGKTGEVMRTWRGERQAQHFGEAIVRVPDLDGDGADELGIVDARQILRVYSTSQENPVKTVDLIAPWDSAIGTKLGESADLNLDGVADYLVGQLGFWIDEKIGQGRVAAYSGADGKLLWERIGEHEDGTLGFGLATIGDVDGDLVSDVAAGEPFGNFPHHGVLEGNGTVYILRGTDGSLIRRLGDDPALRLFGRAVAHLGDLDADGFPELAVGAPGYSEGSRQNLGWVGIYSLRTFTPIRVHRGLDPWIGELFLGDGLGKVLSSAGDADGDQVPDYLLGNAHWAAASFGRSAWGKVELRSGTDGRLLAAYEGNHADSGVPFLTSLAPLGDLDGDGRSEFLIGSEDSDVRTYGEGKVFAVRYEPSAVPFIRADGNGDGVVDISDLVVLVEVMVLRREPGPCPAAIDFDADDRLNTNDFAYLVYYLFEGSYAPAPPFPDCGRYGGLRRRNLGCVERSCTP